MVLEAGYPNTTGFRKVVKMSVMIKKKAGMPDADFVAHYNGVHAQMAAPVVRKHGAISYSLVRHPPFGLAGSRLALRRGRACDMMSLS